MFQKILSQFTLCSILIVVLMVWLYSIANLYYLVVLVGQTQI